MSLNVYINVYMDHIGVTTLALRNNDNGQENNEYIYRLIYKT